MYIIIIISLNYIKLTGSINPHFDPKDIFIVFSSMFGPFLWHSCSGSLISVSDVITVKVPKANEGKITQQQQQNVDLLNSPGITLFLSVCDAIKLVSNLLLSVGERKKVN